MTPPVVAVPFVDLPDAAYFEDVVAAYFEAARAVPAEAEHLPAIQATAELLLEEVELQGCPAMAAEVH